MIQIMTSKYTRKPVPVPLEVRGLARTPLDDHVPVNPLLDEDLLSRYYMTNVQTAQRAYESELNSPSSSGRSSPTIREAQSPLSNSHGGWTERSSLDSSYSLDDFDKQAANTVHQHFEDIESVLFEGSRDSPQAEAFKECQDWSTQFPHLRVLGKQACPSRDLGYQHISPVAQTTPRPGASSLSPDSVDMHMSYSTAGSMGLSISGKNVPFSKPPSDSLASSSSSKSDSASSSYSFLVEEVLAEDGVYEEIIALDYKNIYEDSNEHKKQITPRRRRVGYPPVTPNACVKDSVTSTAFDHIWQEVMSWVRSLAQRYASQFKVTKTETPFSSIIRDQPTPIPLQPRFNVQRSHTHLGNFTDRSINEILKVESKPLQDRNHPLEPTDGSLLPTRPGSSFLSHTHMRPVSHPKRGGRPNRLAPLVDRNKTPSEDDRTASNHMATNALRVKGLNPIASDIVSTSPFHRNGALPPLENGIPRRQHGYRATSAIDNKDTRLWTLRDRSHLITEQTRPNTTHAMRSDTPLGSQNRRSSTPLGQSITARNTLHLAKSLDVRGNSLQHGGVEPSHFHPDILEDQHEAPVEEVIRTHWNPSHLTSSSNIYRRPTNRLPLKW